MPTPIEILLDPISLSVLGIYIGLMAWEALAPAQPLPYVRYWKTKGIISFFLYFYLSSYLPMLIDPLLEPFRLFDLSHWNTGIAAVFGLFLYEFGLYLWHWSMHEYDALWKSFHQMHHSAERIDTYGAFYFSPLDMIGFTLLGSICFTLLVGLPPQAITIFLLSSTFLGMFQHANIKTPHWLGYLIQRPESHALHHARGIHRYNYSDLPVFDMLFGTFRNTRKFVRETGFYQGASDRIVDMLLFKDVTKPPLIQKETASSPVLEPATEEK
jgi:sterol desaturase/sphingolipid hydroxylase (fatty acid hydroxylase superfamily)